MWHPTIKKTSIRALLATVIVLIVAVWSGPARTATVNLTDPACTSLCTVTGITGLLVDGTTYNVSFVYEDIEIDPLDPGPDLYTPPIVSLSFAMMAADAILAAFGEPGNPGFIRDTLGIDLLSNLVDQPTFYFLTGPMDTNTNLSPVYIANTLDSPATQGVGALGQSSSRNWAILTPTTVVPVPASVFLLGMGLISICLFGWLRRPSAR